MRNITFLFHRGDGVESTFFVIIVIIITGMRERVVRKKDILEAMQG